MHAYERALHANQNSVPAMNAISLILRTREEFHKAVDFLQAILKIDAQNGEVWGSLGKPYLFYINRLESFNLHYMIGHCFLMMDDLQQAYAAYQNALINLANPKVNTIACLRLSSLAHRQANIT